MKITKRNLSVVAGLVIVVFFMAFLVACKSEEKVEEKGEEIEITKEMLTPIFGDAEGLVTGIMDVEQTMDDLQISYFLSIEDMSNFDDEIERALAPKIPELYKKFPEIDRTVFTINVPQTGEPPYRPYVSFALDRKLVEETEWSNLLELEFFEVVKDVKYFD